MNKMSKVMNKLSKLFNEMVCKYLYDDVVKYFTNNLGGKEQ